MGHIWGSLLSHCSQECWRHFENHEWRAGAIYGHVHRLASCLVSTKESLEDIIGTLTDRAQRDTRTPLNLTPERLFFQSSRCARLENREPLYTMLRQGDFVNEAARKNGKNRKLIFGIQSPMIGEVTKQMKALVAEGHWGQHGM